MRSTSSEAVMRDAGRRAEEGLSIARRRSGSTENGLRVLGKHLERNVRIGAAMASGCLHVFLLIGLTSNSAPGPLPTLPTAVSFEVAEPPVPDTFPNPEDEPDEQPEPAQDVLERATPTPNPTVAPTVEPPEEHPPAGPVDMTGVTLTNDGEGAGWATAVGNGSTMEGPIRAPTVRPKPRRESMPRSPRTVLRAAASQKRKAPPVPLSDLSRRPSPPALDGVLRANYPAGLRQMGRAGRAVVVARVDTDGRVRVVRVISESDPGFGRACRQTVLGSTWTAPLDGLGRPCMTEVRYTCRFRVDR
jgi:outer membrane biosynthesis protein TonB